MNYRGEIKNIATQFCDTLTKIELFSQDYNHVFSKHRSRGAIGFEADTKAIVLEYYKYISNITNELYNFEKPLSSLFDIVVEAERAYDKKSLALCESILTNYGNSKNEVGEFIKNCESEISKTKGSPSLNVMGRLFEELRRKSIFTHERILSCLKDYEA